MYLSPKGMHHQTLCVCRCRRILLVSGAAGAGKSTFIELMRRDLLPEEISSHLPLDCGRWPVLPANALRKHRVSQGGVEPNWEGTDGVVLHYDFVFPHRCGICEYYRDPAAEFIASGQVSAVVSIKVSRERLLAQFNKRLRALMESKGRLRWIWKMVVHQPVRRLTARLKGGPYRDTLNFYDDPIWLSKRCEQWDAFIHRVSAENPGSKIIYVAPAENAAGSPQFRLIGVETETSVTSQSREPQG